MSDTPRTDAEIISTEDTWIMRTMRVSSVVPAEFARQLERELARATAAPGWKLVPMEPTLYMLAQGKASLYSCSEDPELDDARQCWLFMLAAAPGAGSKPDNCIPIDRAMLADWAACFRSSDSEMRASRAEWIERKLEAALTGAGSKP